MPRVKIPNIPWRVIFYSFDLRERRHVHVFRERMECKVWIADGIESNLDLINDSYEQLLA